MRLETADLHDSIFINNRKLCHLYFDIFCLLNLYFLCRKMTPMLHTSELELLTCCRIIQQTERGCAVLCSSFLTLLAKWQKNIQVSALFILISDTWHAYKWMPHMMPMRFSILSIYISYPYHFCAIGQRLTGHSVG